MRCMQIAVIFWLKQKNQEKKRNRKKNWKYYQTFREKLPSSNESGNYA